MLKKVFILLITSFVFFLNSHVVLAADVNINGFCERQVDRCLPGPNGEAYSCQPSIVPGSTNVQFRCLPSVGKNFDSITPPNPLVGFLSKDPTGAKAISKFLSNLIQLIYIFAAIALLFMLLWGAFDWIMSEGEKEKINSARNKIINAIIGIMLFAVAFAILSIIGTFTGFKFFAEQNTVKVNRDSNGNVTQVICRDGSILYPPLGPQDCK